MVNTMIIRQISDREFEKLIDNCREEIESMIATLVSNQEIVYQEDGLFACNALYAAVVKHLMTDGDTYGQLRHFAETMEEGKIEEQGDINFCDG